MLHSLIDLFLPRRCPVCGRRLVQWSECVCVCCMAGLPYTHHHLTPGNRLEQRFYTITPIERAAGFFHYSPHNAYSHIVHQLKYGGHRHLGLFMGKCMATHMASHFTEVDWLVPVPLSANRRRTRGYNQCELLAQGIHEQTGIPVAYDLLYRTVDNPTQTKLHGNERWENMQDAIGVNLQKAALFEGKHLMVIDDVVTTGATLAQCAMALHKGIAECKVSVVALAATLKE